MITFPFQDLRGKNKIDMSYKLWLLIIGSILPSSHMLGQQPKEFSQGLQYLEKHQLTAQLMGPGLQYEAGIIDPISFSTGFSPGISTFNQGSGLGYALHNRLRFYHNVRSRIAKNKIISGNSANYVAFANSIFFGNLQVAGNLDAPKETAFYFNGGLYGMQRTYQRGFNFQTELGVGYYQGSNMAGGLGILLNLSFGWVFTNRR